MLHYAGDNSHLFSSFSFPVHVLDMSREVRPLGELLITVLASMWAFLLVYGIDMRHEVVPLSKRTAALQAFVRPDFLVDRLNMLRHVALLRERYLTRRALEIFPPVVWYMLMERLALVVLQRRGVVGG